MGGNQSEPYNQKEFLTQWQKVAENQGRTIWRNKQDPTKQLEQYPIYANNEHDVEKQSNLFQLRRNSKNLVSASYLKSTTKSGLCSTASQGKLFLQKIPIRLQDIKDIPFPDILHLHQQALNGYQTLSSQVGPFKPSQQQIGFNNQGVAKVWLNSDYARSTPNIVENSQRAMVRTILQMIESNTDRSSLPPQNPSILNFIYQRKNEVNFEQANGAIRQFASRYNNSYIPTKLDCIQKVGGTQRVYQSINQGNIQGQTNLRPQFNSTGHQFVNNQTQLNNQVNSSVVVPTFQQTQTNFVNFQRPTNTLINQQSNVPLSASKVNTVNTSNVVTVNRNLNQTPVIVNRPQVFINTPPVAVNNTPVFVNNTAQFVRPSLQSGSRVNEVRTVRPQQMNIQSPVFVRPPQQQRVIQQIVRTPPVQYQPIPVMQPITQTQQRRQVVNVNNTNVPVSMPIQNRTQLNNVVKTQVLSNANNTSRTQVISNTNINNNNGQSRNNVITSNTVDLIAGGKQFQSYNSSAQKYGKVQTSNLYGKTQVTSTNYGVSDKVGGDISLEDGKSSEALLRQLRQLSASRQKQTNFDTNIETNYSRNYAAENNYDNYDNDYTYKYTSNNNLESNNYADINQNHDTNHYAAQNNYDGNNDYYGAFKKYSNYQTGNVQHNQANDFSRGLQQNLQMKYSMTQDLYDHNQNGQYNYNNQNNEEYEVDFDPQILADMRKMKA